MEEYSKARVSISLEEYEMLRDLRHQFKFLTDNVEIRAEKAVNPFGNTVEEHFKYGVIDESKLDFFYKNLLDIEKLMITKGVITDERKI